MQPATEGARAGIALLRYLRFVNGLGDLKGSLSGSISTQAIAQANKEFENAVGSAIGGKCGQYTKYSANQRSDIASPGTLTSMEQQQLQDTLLHRIP